MRVLLTMQHPADAHFFRDALSHLESRGHRVRVLVRPKDVLLDLLDHYGIGHERLAGPAGGVLELARVQARYELGILREALAFDPDVLAAVAEPSVAHAGTMTGTPAVVFTDTGHATVQNVLAQPFADRVVTPACYRGGTVSTHVRYPGYHELAYLHPDRFTPDPSVREELVGDRDEPLVVLRLIAWGAAHDVGEAGLEDPVAVVSRLERAGAVVRISAEGTLPPELRAYELELAPHRIHDALACADVYLGEGATMAAESAVLGTPAVFASTLELGYLEEMESEFGLLRNVHGPDRWRQGVRSALDLSRRDDWEWERRRRRLLSERVDTRDVIVDQLESAGG